MFQEMCDIIALIIIGKHIDLDLNIGQYERRYISENNNKKSFECSMWGEYLKP